jgi:predicted outer membrane repeat protein
MRTLLALAGIALCGLVGEAALGQTPVGGAIDADTTWGVADSPFQVNESVRVVAGATLTIEPGVEVEFEPGTSLAVETGTLVARGTFDDRIEFKRGRGLSLTAGATDAVLDPDTGAYLSGTALEFVEIWYVDAGSGAALDIDASLPLLRNVRVQEIAGGGIAMDLFARPDADVRLEGVDVFVASRRGLLIEGGNSVTLERVRVGNIAIADRRGAALQIELRGRSLPTPSEPDIELIDVEVFDVSARWGIVCDGGWARATNLTVENCDGIGYLTDVRRFDIIGGRFVDNFWHVDIFNAREGGAIRSATFTRGGGVRLEGPCEVIGSRFEGITNGPALSGRTATIRDCLFLNNASPDDGGALEFAFGSLELYDSAFENNSALRGGAIFSDGVVTSAGNTFVRNRAQYGGAAWLGERAAGSTLGEPGRPDVYLDNTALEAGGAMHVAAVGVGLVANEFEGNEAVFGGAISVDPLGSGLNLNRPGGGVGNRLVANHALFGSDIYLFQPEPTAPAADTDARCVDWGTSDPAAIADRIYDGADQPGLPEVLYLPLGPCVGCPADFDGDGALTIFDYLAFANLFDDGDLRADLDGDGELTLFDFLAFQTAFGAGCP